MVECACVIESDTYVDPVETIKFCPLHAKAQALKDRLKGLLEAHQGIMMSGGQLRGRSQFAEEWFKAQSLLEEIDNG